MGRIDSIRSASVKPPVRVSSRTLAEAASAFRGVRLRRGFFRADAVSLARRLLGMRLVRVLEDGARLAGAIVETEAYCGVEDRACHSFGGRRTPRNDAMYARPGTAYVYFTYGMHHCFNVVCGREDEPVAVLIRALEPAEGIERMRRARQSQRSKTPLDDRALTSGPARLCQALSIDRTLNGVDLARSGALWIERGVGVPTGRGRIRTGPRIGVSSAGDWALRPLRFWVADSPWVSRRPG